MKLLLILFISAAFAFAEETDNKAEEVIEEIMQKVDPLEIYRKLFEQKRKNQIDAVKSLKKAGNYEKQYAMIQQTSDMLFKVVADARLKLQEQQFSPGDTFPEDKEIRDAYSTILENVAFFGEFLLRHPGITHDILKRNNEWDLAIKWGVGFCEQSQVYQGPHAKLLNLMAMELGIIPKSENYVNPYSEEEKEKASVDDVVSQILAQTEQKLSKEELLRRKKMMEKRKARKEQRGPKISHSEL
ncbi:hypothetical protein CAPTEDRAFT_225708 [Capitella teleta]|uniref:Coiled-coil domain-containing protein 134 n=1 Tax=Capitella teleta TaxID=283909 RepID=R7UQV1_CAPTE|nr:hypothetical protein CAPTEDRAFT_225708 [Capitella teleta]|eukprot:ELU08909.1 hypothetical protein CAPTEDRAFT_225708 [Capitella teleta]